MAKNTAANTNNSKQSKQRNTLPVRNKSQIKQSNTTIHKPHVKNTSIVSQNNTSVKQSKSKLINNNVSDISKRNTKLSNLSFKNMVNLSYKKSISPNGPARKRNPNKKPCFVNKVTPQRNNYKLPTFSRNCENTSNKRVRSANTCKRIPSSNRRAVANNTPNRKQEMRVRHPTPPYEYYMREKYYESCKKNKSENIEMFSTRVGRVWNVMQYEEREPYYAMSSADFVKNKKLIFTGKPPTSGNKSKSCRSRK